MPRKALTDRSLKAIKPAPKGKHIDHWDAIVPGMGVRVSDTGRKTFVLVMRFPGSRNPTRRALGEYGAVTLDDARRKARDWLELIRKGIDPVVQQERERAAELRKQENSFAAVAEDFIRDKLATERKGEEVARDIRRVFIPAWGRRPITDVSALEVRNLIKGFKDDGKLYQAHNLLGYVRRLFNWAIDQQVYGIESSPCERLKPKAIIGERALRTRVLNDAELKAAWKAAGSLGYPYGPLFQMLMLTGQRKSEVAEARWSEFDLQNRLWTIPAGRMKADAVHIVPISDDVLALLQSLPRFRKGDFLFSTTYGAKPVNGLSKAKERLDARMTDALGAKPKEFVLHDIRRTVRTGLSAIPTISDLVRELVIGHTKPGLHKVYDQYAYLDEKRHALDAWAARLRSIAEPPPSNVVQFEARA